MRKEINLSGKLIFNDDGEFVIQTKDGIYNITTVLDYIYKDASVRYIHCKIMKLAKILFNEEGLLYKRLDSDGLNSYFVCGVNLDKTLFDLVDKDLEIKIKFETTAGERYGQTRATTI